MAADDTTAVDRSGSLLLVWDVSPDQEEPWRRFLQELSGPRLREFAKSRHRASVSAETVWFAPRSSGGGVAIVWLEAEDPEQSLRKLTAELAAMTPFDSRYATQMCGPIGCDSARLARAVRGERLFGWRGTSGEGDQPEAEGSVG